MAPAAAAAAALVLCGVAGCAATAAAPAALAGTQAFYILFADQCALLPGPHPCSPSPCQPVTPTAIMRLPLT